MTNAEELLDNYISYLNEARRWNADEEIVDFGQWLRWLADTEPRRYWRLAARKLLAEMESDR